MSGRDDESCAGPLSLEHSVGCGRGVVVQELEGPREVEVALQDLTRFGDAVVDPNALVWHWLELWRACCGRLG